MALPASPTMAIENQVPNSMPNRTAATIATSARIPTHRSMAPRNEKSFRVQKATAVSPPNPRRVTVAALSMTPP